MGSSSTDFCHELFKYFLASPISVYILFVVKNRELFRSNSDVQNINKRNITTYIHP